MLLAVVAALIAFFLVHIERNGIPPFVCHWVEQQLAEQEVYIDCEKVEFSFSEGISFKEFKLYGDEAKSSEDLIFQGKSVHIDAYKRLFFIGTFKPKSFNWKGDKLKLEGLTSEGKKESYHFENLNGQMSYDVDGNLKVDFVEVTWNHCDIRVSGSFPKVNKSSQSFQEGEVSLFDIPSHIVDVLETLKRLEFKPNGNNKLDVTVQQGEEKEWKISLSMLLEEVSYEQAKLESVEVDLAFEDQIIKVSKVNGVKNGKAFTGVGKLNLQHKSFHLDIDSELNFLALYHDFLGAEVKSPIDCEVNGDFTFKGHIQGCFATANYDLSGYGVLDISTAEIEGVHLESASAKCAFDKSGFVLKQIEGRDGDHYIKGQITRIGGLFKYDLRARAQPEHAVKTLHHFGFYEFLTPIKALGSDSWAEFTVKGHRVLGDPMDWQCDLAVEAESIAYNEAEASRIKAEMVFTSEHSIYKNISATPRYQNYSLRKRYGGARQGSLSIQEIKHDRKKESLRFTGVKGSAWPAPIVRSFLPELADNLELYEAHNPPYVTLSGSVDFSGKNAHDLKIFFSANKMNYTFLEESVFLQNVKGSCLVKGQQVKLDWFKGLVLGGDLNLVLNVDLRAKKPLYKGEVRVNDLSYPRIAKLYKFEQDTGGRVSGYSSFTMRDAEVDSLNGSGKLVVDQAEFLSIPILGPLSKVMDKVLSVKNLFNQKATKLTASFQINKGVVRTDDLLTKVGSFKFKGSGAVDLVKSEIDMTIKTKGRGLIKVLTIPLSPILGMLTFKGEGTLEEPEWSIAPHAK